MAFVRTAQKHVRLYRCSAISFNLDPTRPRSLREERLVETEFGANATFHAWSWTLQRTSQTAHDWSKFESQSVFLAMTIFLGRVKSWCIFVFPVAEKKHDGQLAPAYLLPIALYDQLFQLFEKLKRKLKSILNLVLKTFPRISSPPSLNSFPGIISLSELRSKIQNPRYCSKKASENKKLASEILMEEIQS